MNTLLAKLSPTITTMIRFDHTHGVATHHPFEADSPPGVKQALVNTVCTALEIHTSSKRRSSTRRCRRSTARGSTRAFPSTTRCAA